jgi:hypothetical protein
VRCEQLGGRSAGAPRDTAPEAACVSGDVESAGVHRGYTDFGYSDSPPSQDPEYGSAMNFTEPDGNATGILCQRLSGVAHIQAEGDQPRPGRHSQAER